MSKYLFIVFVLIFPLEKVSACTSFLMNQNGKLVFGRNYDWVSGSGMVNTNLRGLAKTSFPMQEGNTISWVSMYGSITFNQYGKEFPTGGMNEKGLVVELMWLDGTQYPVPDRRPAINVLQWIQYQLDNCATIEEVIETDKEVRIAAVGTTPLHYLVADKKGNAATIEFLDGRMIVHKGKELSFPVLTNNTYQESEKHALSFSNNKNFTGSSLGRFAKACSMLEEYRTGKSNRSPVDYSFKILDEVAQGDFTKWSIVYDISESRIYFKTHSQPAIKTVDFASFNFSCSSVPMAFDINTTEAGQISKWFVHFSKDLNLKTVQKSFGETADRISIPRSYADKITAYLGLIKCQ
ncbi:MAG: linear amide C-N hydrolase [Chitinophagaceae bacterium]|nr:linear amide C-N hydrolase [Chitinophagaceae bacterium]